MRRTFAVVVLTIALALSAGGGSAFAGQYDYLLAPTTVCANQTNTSLSVETQESAMVCMHKYARAKARLTGLTARRLLMDSSGYKAQDIMRCQDFRHNACGRSDVFYWPKRLGYTSSGCWGLGENIAWGSGSYGSVRSIMRTWLYSDPHRHNILNGRFRDIGEGLVKGTFKGYPNAQVWVTHFGYRC